MPNFDLPTWIFAGIALMLLVVLTSVLIDRSTNIKAYRERIDTLKSCIKSQEERVSSANTYANTIDRATRTVFSSEELGVRGSAMATSIVQRCYPLNLSPGALESVLEYSISQGRLLDDPDDERLQSFAEESESRLRSRWPKEGDLIINFANEIWDHYLIVAVEEEEGEVEERDTSLDRDRV